VADGKRADAQQNRDLLLATARTAFADTGIDASLRDIARQAGVGIGTLYRHFRTRDALLEELLDANFTALRHRADELLATSPPEDAFRTWLKELATEARTYYGLPQSILNALDDETSDLHNSCATMRAAGAQLLHRAQSAGRIRPDITIYEAIALTLGLALAAQHPGGPTNLLDRLLTTAMHGMALPT
jgi:AcrR family transcriptional regulator